MKCTFAGCWARTTVARNRSATIAKIGVNCREFIAFLHSSEVWLYSIDMGKNPDTFHEDRSSQDDARGPNKTKDSRGVIMDLSHSLYLAYDCGVLSSSVRLTLNI